MEEEKPCADTEMTAIEMKNKDEDINTREETKY